MTLRYRMPALIVLLITAPLLFANDLPSGGDVLNPGAPSNVRVMVGLEAGLTYTSFTNGPFQFSFADPFKSYTTFVRDLDAGSGLGFHAGATFDVLLSDRWALYAKLRYVLRHGSFSKTNPETCIDSLGFSSIINVDDQLALNIGMLAIDIGARYFVTPKQWYVMAGLSVGVPMMAKSYTMSESIVQPSTCMYLDDLNNRVATSLSTSGDISNGILSQMDGVLGAGVLIPLQPKVYLDPELTVGIPFNKILDGIELKTLVLYPTVGIKIEL